MKMHHVNRAYFAQQIVRCYDQYRLVKEFIQIAKYQACGYEFS